MDRLNVLSKSLRFVAMARRRHRAFDEFLSTLCDIGDPILFGGAVRDIALFEEHATPRDFDFVVDGVHSEQLERVVREQRWMYRKNKFGGLKLMVGGYKVDVWPLATTWAFRHKRVPSPVAANLPSTVFLNVDAVAVSLKDATVFESGFLRALNQRIIDIVLPDNPFPALNIMRALVLRERLNCRLSDSLRDYVITWSRNQRDPVQTVRTMETHRYGRASITEASFAEAVNECAD